MSLILDVAALAAVSRGERAIFALLEAERRAGRPPRTHGGVLASAYAPGLATALEALEVVPLDLALARRAGALAAKLRRCRPEHAALALLAGDGDVVLTDAPRELDRVVRALGLDVDVVPLPLRKLEARARRAR